LKTASENKISFDEFKAFVASEKIVAKQLPVSEPFKIFKELDSLQRGLVVFEKVACWVMKVLPLPFSQQPDKANLSDVASKADKIKSRWKRPHSAAPDEERFPTYANDFHFEYPPFGQIKGIWKSKPYGILVERAKQAQKEKLAAEREQREQGKRAREEEKAKKLREKKDMDERKKLAKAQKQKDLEEKAKSSAILANETTSSVAAGVIVSTSAKRNSTSSQIGSSQIGSTNSNPEESNITTDSNKPPKRPSQREIAQKAQEEKKQKALERRAKEQEKAKAKKRAAEDLIEAKKRAAAEAAKLKQLGAQKELEEQRLKKVAERNQRRALQAKVLDEVNSKANMHVSNLLSMFDKGRPNAVSESAAIEQQPHNEFIHATIFSRMAEAEAQLSELAKISLTQGTEEEREIAAALQTAASSVKELVKSAANSNEIVKLSDSRSSTASTKSLIAVQNLGEFLEKSIASKKKEKLDSDGTNKKSSNSREKNSKVNKGKFVFKSLICVIALLCEFAPA
jgi:hypothetical protein